MPGPKPLLASPAKQVRPYDATRMHNPIAKTGAWLNRMLKGHLNYYAVSGNSPSLWWYFNEVQLRWLKSLKRRSPRADFSTTRS